MLHPCSSLFILLHILNMTYIIAYTRGIMYGYFLTDTLLYFFLVCFLSKIKPNKRGEGCKVSVHIKYITKYYEVIFHFTIIINCLYIYIYFFMGILHYNINVEWFKIAITLHIHDAKMC